MFPEFVYILYLRQFRKRDIIDFDFCLFLLPDFPNNEDDLSTSDKHKYSEF